MHAGPFDYSRTSVNWSSDRGEEWLYPERVRSSQKQGEGLLTIMSKSSGESIEPHHNDVLMGRGGKNNQHSGNEILRRFARQEWDNYRKSTKKGKSIISRALVVQMHDLDPPSRFLKKNQETGEWEEVSDDTAREKASQVLRDAVAHMQDRRDEEMEDEKPPALQSSADSPLPSSTGLSYGSAGVARAPLVSESQVTPVDSQSSEVMAADAHDASRRKRRRRFSPQPIASAAEIGLEFASYTVPYSPVQLRRSSRQATRRVQEPSTPGATSSIHHGLDPAPPPAEMRSDLNELLHGELLESDLDDDDDEGPPPPMDRDLF